MKKSLLAMLLAVIMVAAVIFIAAPATKAETVEADITLSADTTETLVIDSDKVLNLNGFNATVSVNKGVTLTIVDTKFMEGNWNLDGTSAGTLTVAEGSEGTIKAWEQFGDYKYLAVKNGNTYSAHPFNIMLTNVGVNTHSSKITVGITVIADNVVANLIDAGEFGLHNHTLELEKNRNHPEYENRYAKHFAKFNGKNGLQVYFDLTNSLNKDVLDENRSNEFGAYIKVNAGYGDVIVDSKATTEIAPKAVLEKVNEKASGYTADQQDMMIDMCNTAEYLKYYCCNFCGHITTEDNKDATCEEAGYTRTTYTCSCNKTDETIIPATGHTYVDGVCSCGATNLVETTVTINISEYASANNWINSQKYSNFKLDDNITVSASTGGDNGKYYTNGNNWRLYQSDKGTVTISVAKGSIVSIKITYTISNTGVLTFNGINVPSGTKVDVGAESITLSVGNTGTATNGQARITTIEVTYLSTPPCDHDYKITTETQATCTETGLKVETCSKCNGTKETVIEATGHDLGELVVVKAATCTETGSGTKTCSVCSATETVTIDATGHTTDNGVCGNCNETIGGTTTPTYENKTYSYTFNAKQYSANGKKTLNSIDWTLAGNGGYWGYDSTKGQQLGSGGSPYKSLTLTSAVFTNVSKIVINTSGASSITGTLTVTVGGKQIGETIKLTSTATSYTFESTELLSGEIVLTYTQTSSKAIYIKAITVYHQKEVK